MPLLLLSERDVTRLVDMPLAIEVMEQAFRALSAGRAENVPRVRAAAEGIVLHSMSAAAEYLGLVGWKQYTTTAGGAKFHVGLYDQRTGDPVALIEADRLGQVRTGAVSGLAAKYLANANSAAVGLFGSGWQAQSQLAAVAAACPLTQAFVFSRHRERRRAFAKQMSAELNIEVVAVEQPQQAVEGLPLVITATTSNQPVFAGEWLAPGALVCAMGSNWPHKAELDATAFGRAEHVVCDSVACCHREAGDLLQAAQQGVFDWERAVELSDVVAGKSPGRADSSSIVIFKSVGMAIEDVALAGTLVRKRMHEMSSDHSGE